MVLEKKRTEKMIRQDIERLQEWLSLQPHLPHDVDEELLSSFVHGTPSLEIAKQKLDSFFSWRGQLPQFFSGKVRDPSDPYFRQVAKVGEVFFFPDPTPEGYRILYFNMNELFDQFFDHDIATTIWLMNLELVMLLWPENTGIFLVGDMSCFTASCFKKMSLITLETVLRCFLACYPVKMKRLLLFNSHPMLDGICNSFIKPLLPEKLFKRVMITSDDKSCLKKHLPEELLPSNYGGKGKPSSELYENWLRLLEEKKDWFQKTSHLVANESKRLRIQDNYGVEGTFRKLSLD